MVEVNEKSPELGSQPLIKDIAEGDRITGYYLVNEKRTGTTRNGKTFMGLVLSDQSGNAEAKVWDRVDEYSPLFNEGDIIYIEGETESFRNQIQIRINGIGPCKEDIDPSIFLETSPFNPSEMMNSLKKILTKIENVHLKGIINKFLTDKEFVAQFMMVPAAKNFHHSYIGGLLEHTLSVCRMSVEVAALYPRLDRDILITSAFLHDIGKIKELSYKVKIDYTDEGRLLGHLVLGVNMLEEKIQMIKNFPQEISLRLKHVIISHHGQYEFGSPKRPKFLEAMALHMIDDFDAKINGLSTFMDKDRNEGAWTDFNRLFGQFFLKGEIHSQEIAQNKEEQDETLQRRLF